MRIFERNKKMKLEPAELKTTSFYIKQKGIEDGFILEVIETKSMFEAWIYHAEYGIKSLMFGLMKEDTTYNDFIETATANLMEYITDYIEQYFEV